MLQTNILLVGYFWTYLALKAVFLNLIWLLPMIWDHVLSSYMCVWQCLFEKKIVLLFFLCVLQFLLETHFSCFSSYICANVCLRHNLPASPHMSSNFGWRHNLPDSPPIYILLLYLCQCLSPVVLVMAWSLLMVGMMLVQSELRPSFWG